jgi:hypothetical protein
MFPGCKIRKSAAMLLVVILSVMLQATVIATSPAFGSPQKNDEKKQLPNGTPVLWREPTDIASRDLMTGPGGDAMKPDLSKVTLIKEEPKTGYSVKYRVRDAAGQEWVVKVGEEAQAETAASRLVWAAGYLTDITYLAPLVNIEGKGTVENARFEARPKDVKRYDEEWDWEKNPFAGSQELQGLKVLMVMLNNWDLKSSNNRIIVPSDQTSGTTELRYVVSDLGATFGKTGNFIKHNRNRPNDYAKSKFVTGVNGNIVKFGYDGKNSGILKSITVEQAKWLGKLMAQLSDQQIEDAFRAANYKPEDIKVLAGTVRARINALTAL